MIDTPAMAKVYNTDQLLKVFASNILLETSSLNFSEQLSASDMLQHKVYLGFGSHNQV
jgi:hypothetical protein